MTGIAHRPYAYRTYHLFDNLTLQADLEVELIRESLYRSKLGDLGRTFTKQPYPGHINLSDSVRCFDTAFTMATRYGLVYCEGLMIFTLEDGSKLPMAHAWCCNLSGKVIDATNQKYQDHDRVEYWGVPIRLGYEKTWHEFVGYHGILDGYPDGTLSPVFTQESAIWMEVVHVR